MSSPILFHANLLLFLIHVNSNSDTWVIPCVTEHSFFICETPLTPTQPNPKVSWAALILSLIRVLYFILVHVLSGKFRVSLIKNLWQYYIAYYSTCSFPGPFLYLPFPHLLSDSKINESIHMLQTGASQVLKWQHMLLMSAAGIHDMSVSVSTVLWLTLLQFTVTSQSSQLFRLTNNAIQHKRMVPIKLELRDSHSPVA